MKQYTEIDHTFVVCAYGESPYLEECILSILNQEVLGNIVVVTSTNNKHVQQITSKHNLKLYINPSGGSIAKDWNFGIQIADTKLVTLAHQDDIYLPQYLKLVLKDINEASKPLIAFTDYGEKREKKVIYDTKMLKIKKMMLMPLKIKKFQNCVWIRRIILAMGSAICCPSVTFIRENLTLPIFSDGFKSNLDWEAWENLSKWKGSFVYCSKPLMLHRIHAESTTSRIIGDNRRIKEDYEMFCKFWPEWIAKIILFFYKEAEKYNNS